jgi:hypothetical protein
MLKDPESFPAIMSALLQGRLGGAYEAALIDAGLDPSTATTAEIEDAFYAPDARVLALTPELAWASSDRRSTPRYDWVIESYSSTS